MTVSVPTTEPAELRAGVTWKWRREDLADYPATTWTLTYWLKQAAAAGARFSIVATADGTAFAVTVAAATTAGYTADTYTWVAVVTSGSEAYEVDRGTLELRPKYNADAALDGGAGSMMSWSTLKPFSCKRVVSTSNTLPCVLNMSGVSPVTFLPGRGLSPPSSLRFASASASACWRRTSARVGAVRPSLWPSSLPRCASAPSS